MAQLIESRAADAPDPAHRPWWRKVPMVRRDASGRPGLLVQAALITVFLIAYDALRNLAPGRIGLALQHAQSVLSFEGDLHIDIEHAFNDWLDPVHWLSLAASTYYDSAHYVITMPLLFAVYVWRPRHYRRIRDVLLVTNLVGLIGFATYPLAPPRLIQPLGTFHDTVKDTGALGGFGTAVETKANEYAAMPSLHMGWALWVVIVTFTVTSIWWLRALAITHAAITFFVIIATGNHYVSDAVAGAACLAVSVLAVELYQRARARIGYPVHDHVPAGAPSREPVAIG